MPTSLVYPTLFLSAEKWCRPSNNSDDFYGDNKAVNQAYAVMIELVIPIMAICTMAWIMEVIGIAFIRRHLRGWHTVFDLNKY